MSERFIIECYGIIDTWNAPNGNCKDKLSWNELCDTLNELDKMVDDKYDNYEYVVKLEKENEELREQLRSITGLLQGIKDYIYDIDLLLEKK